MTATKLPQVDRILREESLVALQGRIKRELLTKLVREELSRLRESGGAGAEAHEVAATVAQQAETLLRPTLRKVINGTGIVLNTNLGRAPISQHVLSDLVQLGSGYCNLELDLESGKRGRRSDRISRLLEMLTGADAAIAVNNNAAAVVLIVNALAAGKKVAVSRGELIEIGGSFRLPDVIEAAGASLQEVGTTNRTRAGDYQKAIQAGAALIMRCHRSNFQITGFTESASLDELVAVSKTTGVPFVEDLGSGLLCPLPSAAGLKSEPTVQEVVAAGCDLVCFSGDKLLGGAQAGFIVGKRALIERLHKHPLYRALRLDKLTISLIERTLIAYLSPDETPSLPALQMLATDPSHLQRRAESLARTISDGTKKLRCTVVTTKAAPGGGSLPGEEIDSFGIKITSGKVSANVLAKMLRENEPPVVAMIQSDAVILDFRTIFEDEEQMLMQALTRVDNRIS